MSDNIWLDDPDLACDIVRGGEVVLDSARNKAGEPIVKEKIRALRVLSDAEQQSFKDLREQIERYRDLKKPDRPLCFGLFGPPGSGKSFGVKQIIESMEQELKTINLSQLEGPDDLAAAIVKVASARTSPLMFLFFDEFDSKLAGTRLGWLQWLLAPMQDGVVFYQGSQIELKRAVYFFAGGTSDSFESFPQAHEGYFREAKGPDFISRLRGHINVRGVNEGPYRRVRRAIILRNRIDKVASHWVKKDARIEDDRMSKELIDRILAVGRFIHGSRSVESLIDMSRFEDHKFTEGNLPHAELRASHVDLGPLGKTAIALSAGGNNEKEFNDVWQRVAIHLLELGAGLIYGGNLSDSGLTQVLIKALSALPNPLGKEPDQGTTRAARPRPARLTCFGTKEEQEEFDTNLTKRVDFRGPRPGLTAIELHELALKSNADVAPLEPEVVISEDSKELIERKRLGSALQLFRLRAEITGVSDARIAFFGRNKDFWGRFPGIAEEIMLSLAYKRPLYLCGAFGGAAQAVGEMLGLGTPWFETPPCLLAESHPPALALEAAIKDWADRFQLPHRSDLPLNYKDLVTFLRAHAIDGGNWPDNGLTPEENRELFRSKKHGTIVELIEKGLRRRFEARRPKPD